MGEVQQKEAINELYDFIVGTNNEYAIVRCCENKKVADELAEWFQIDEGDEDED